MKHCDDAIMITTCHLLFKDQIRSLQFCSLCLVAGMVDGQVCIYRLNECLSEPGHNPTPWKQKEVRVFGCSQHVFIKYTDESAFIYRLAFVIFCRQREHFKRFT